MTDTLTDRQELLNFIHKNAQMGEESIGYLLDVTDDDTMRDFLQQQRAEYADIMQQACDMLQQDGARPQGWAAWQKCRRI